MWHEYGGDAFQYLLGNDIWIPYIKTLLIDTNNKFNEINYDVELNKSINYAKLNYSNLTNDTYIEKIISKVGFDLLIDDFYELVNSSLISLNFDDVIQNIDKTYDEFRYSLDITGTKTFVGSKKIAFKQSGANDKLGFTLYNKSSKEHF